MSALTPRNNYRCGGCGRPAQVVVVNRKTGVVYDYTCSWCAESALRAGPHLDYPLDTEARMKAANIALDDYYGGM